MADYMLATQRSATQDRAVHRTSPLTALKALRWLSRIAEWQDLGTALNAPVVSSYAHATISKDRRESYPIPLAVIVGFERAVCDPATSDTIALLLGAILLCTHASLRFGDAQRIAWHSLQLSPTALHGTCYRTKTSVSGQPLRGSLARRSRPRSQDFLGIALARSSGTAIHGTTNRTFGRSTARLHVYKL